MPKRRDPQRLRNPEARAVVTFAERHGLAPRDAHLLYYIVHEASLPEISEAEDINSNTLKLRVRSLLRRVDAPSLQVAVIRALREALEEGA